MSHQTGHLGVLVIRPEVEMQSALSLRALIKPDEIQPRQAIRLRADLELISRGVDHDPTKSLGPPLPQGHRIYRVNNYLFPFQGHPPNLDRPGLQEQAFSSEETPVMDYVISPRCQVDLSQVADQINPLLVEGEQAFVAYKGMRDYVVFTSKRIIAVNVQGITGK